MREDSIIVFLEDDAARAALAFQRMKQVDRERTFWVQTVDETIDILQDYCERLDIVSLSHDLGGQKHVYSGRDDTGMEIVRWLEKQDPALYAHVRFIVHSHNGPASAIMTRRLRSRGYRIIRAPFGE